VGAARAVHERSPRRSGDGTGWHRCRNIFGAALALGNHTKAGLQAGWQIHSEFPHDADLLSAAGLRAQVCIALHEVGSARPRLRRMRQHCLRLGRNTPGDAILIRARQQPVHALRNSEPKASACTAPCQERLNDRLRGRAFVRIGGPLAREHSRILVEPLSSGVRLEMCQPSMAVAGRPCGEGRLGPRQSDIPREERRTLKARLTWQRPAGLVSSCRTGN
jgi:hypothetical protein